MEMKILAGGLVFPECPRWHDGELYFSDQHDGIVWRLDLDGSLTEVLRLPSQPSGLGWLPDGSLLVVSMLDRRLIRCRDGVLTEYAGLSGHIQHNANDMLVDSAGRAWVGNFGFDLDHGEDPRSTVLLRVDPVGSVHIAATDLWFPNGMVIDGHSLIVAETFGNRLTAFDIEPGGALSNRRVFAALDGLFPDGIALDSERGVWVACATNHKVIRVMEGGAITGEIAIEGRDAFACQVGGPAERDLFICTATHFRPSVTKEARAGRVEQYRF